ARVGLWCRSGLRVGRPASRAVVSPQRSATHPCANSCTTMLSRKTGKTRKKVGSKFTRTAPDEAETTIASQVTSRVGGGQAARAEEGAGAETTPARWGARDA